MTPVIGGIGITGFAIILLFNYLMGGDVNDVFNQIENIPIEPGQNVNNQEFLGEDEYEVFASTVLGSNNDTWSEIFKNSNRSYIPPKLVLFRTATESSCGTATSSVGPHYCPTDKTIYLDETFFDELTYRYGARGGDVAEAYVISHEVAHHVQNELGIMAQVSMISNEDSIKLELQADCFAGLWANSIKDREVFEAGEIREAMDAAAAVGDDRIQSQAMGGVNPETWTHGSSEERVGWFNKGFESGNFTSCNTFN